MLNQTSGIILINPLMVSFKVLWWTEDSTTFRGKICSLQGLLLTPSCFLLAMPSFQGILKHLKSRTIISLYSFQGNAKWVRSQETWVLVPQLLTSCRIRRMVTVSFYGATPHSSFQSYDYSHFTGGIRKVKSLAQDQRMAEGGILPKSFQGSVSSSVPWSPSSQFNLVHYRIVY